jgi:hypothetical protein
MAMVLLSFIRRPDQGNNIRGKNLYTRHRPFMTQNTFSKMGTLITQLPNALLRPR